MDETRPPKVWVLFRQHGRASQGADDPGLELEGFATIRDATALIGERFSSRQGETFYLHPDRADEDGYREWPDLDKATAHAEVWLASEHPDVPPGWQPDATSEPDERWTPRGIQRVERTRY